MTFQIESNSISKCSWKSTLWLVLNQGSSVKSILMGLVNLFKHAFTIRKPQFVRFQGSNMDLIRFLRLSNLLSGQKEQSKNLCCHASKLKRKRVGNWNSNKARQSSTKQPTTMSFGDCSFSTSRKMKSRVSKICRNLHLRFFWCLMMKSGRKRWNISSNISKDQKRGKWRQKAKRRNLSQEVTPMPKRSGKWTKRTKFEFCSRSKCWINYRTTVETEDLKLVVAELFLHKEFWSLDTMLSICSTSQEIGSKRSI